LAKKPVAKKTAVKKTPSAAIPPPEYVKNFEDAQQSVRDLQLSLKTLKKKLDCLCHSGGYIYGPPPPPKR